MSGIFEPEALVLGASGSVGCGVVAALLEAASPVLAAGRDSPRMQALATRHADEPGLELLRTGGIGTDRAAAALVARLRKRRRPLRAVFASLAGPLQGGRLIELPSDVLRRTLELDLIPHLAAARHLVPLLAEYSGTAHYILIGGPMAERGWSGYGHASIAAAALRMLANVLHEEAQAHGVRVQMLSVEQPLCTPANHRNACAQWPHALAVGRHAVSLLTHEEPPRALVRFDVARALLPPRALFAVRTNPLSLHEISP